ncbi:DUF2125 domain-containing protein [Jannaschia sp. W003]|uniref:DUF2125 domain-containing protein n=1 Tax=Jannaschia sp. W003 TaxID=2867012 RepID=UPI0021A91FC7|nr:DUF2125 domain-containing protein [Jannaschia sp. W003]UWQ21712.1 DUF2125 domain-containing protein [Jannaschia sp. W003]
MLRLLSAVSAWAILAAAPAAALTAPELWESWQATLGRYGATLTAESEDYSGGTLRLEGIVAEAPAVGDAEPSTTRYGALSLVEVDGAVRIEPPAQLEIETTSGGETSALVLEHEGLDYTVREEDGAHVYDGAAARLSYTIDDVSEGDSEAPVPMTLTLSDVASRTRLGADDRYEGTFSGGMRIEATSEGMPSFTLDYALAGIEGTASGTLPDPGALAGDPAAAPERIAFDLDTEVTHAGGRTALQGTGPQGPFAVDGSSGGGRIAVALSPEAMGYEVSSSEMAITLTRPGLPLPVNLSLAEANVALDVPLAADAGLQPYAMRVLLEELAVDETLWALFDPTGQLARDPATLELAIDGEAEVLADLFDPAAMEAMAGSPLLPRTLNLAALLVRVAGAELRGTGALQFPGLPANPMPLGTATLELDGGFALLDGLVALGFVPPQQAALVKGMAGAVAQPVGDDALRSDLEFTETGVLANGLPLPF